MENAKLNNLKNTMKIKFDFNNMMSEFIGDDGIVESQINELSSYVNECIISLNKKRKESLEWMDLPYNQEDIVREILQVAAEIKKDYDTFVLIGIGGQALGPIAVQEALNHPHYNELSKEQRKGYPRFYAPDNVDPEKLNAILDIIDITKTKFFISSKSGNTSEILAHFMIITDLLKQKLGNDYKDNIICLTNYKKGTLLDIVKREGYRCFDMPEGVGGRFSIFSASGLLPAATCGINIEEFLAGAAFMAERCSSNNIYENPAIFAAVLQYLALKNGKNISVMMPYSYSLRYIADWYAQLWAESLGKRLDNDGNEVFTGQTPVKALGVTDQHSQVQLYNEGPFDKVITFIKVDKFRNEINIPKIYDDLYGASFLCNHTLGELTNAEQYATEYALMKAKRMNNTIILPEVNAFTLGQLLYFFEVQTAFMGELLNIDAFNQPGVEDGKIATFALLNRKGYEANKAELDSAPAKRSKYIL